MIYWIIGAGALILFYWIYRNSLRLNWDYDYIYGSYDYIYGSTEDVLNIFFFIFFIFYSIIFLPLGLILIFYIIKENKILKNSDFFNKYLKDLYNSYQEETGDKYQETIKDIEEFKVKFINSKNSFLTKFILLNAFNKITKIFNKRRKRYIKKKRKKEQLNNY